MKPTRLSSILTVLLFSTSLYASGGSSEKPRDVEAFAPGRVELIGGHTDYNLGFVIAMPLEKGPNQRLGAHVHLKWNDRADDRTVTILSHTTDSAGKPGILRHTYELGKETAVTGWQDYFMGVTSVLNSPVIQKKYGLPGGISRGFIMEVTSDVPFGGGLSSSAAILVAEIRAFSAALGFEKQLGVVEVAKLAQAVERDFVGANVGLMDQLTISGSQAERGALFMDFSHLENPTYRHIPLNSEIEFVVYYSGVKHSLSDTHGENFNTRRAECNEALARWNTALQAKGESALESLSQITLKDLKSATFLAFPEKLKKRITHIVTENARVLDAADAIAKSDWKRFGADLYASHASARDLYQISVPEVDALIQIVSPKNGSDPEILSQVIGARLVGGGFGGSVVVAVKAGHAHEVAEYLDHEYAKVIQKMYVSDPAHAPIGKIMAGLREPEACPALLAPVRSSDPQ